MKFQKLNLILLSSSSGIDKTLFATLLSKIMKMFFTLNKKGKECKINVGVGYLQTGSSNSLEFIQPDHDTTAVFQRNMLIQNDSEDIKRCLLQKPVPLASYRGRSMLSKMSS